MKLPTPEQIKSELPLLSPERIFEFRKTASAVLSRSDRRLAAIMGPCSIHDFASALEYAKKVKDISPEIEESFFPIMRIFFEKPRTRLGWKGLLYDPHLDGSNEIAVGIRKSRELILKITELGVPCASELLEPMLIPYFDDLITWGLIGARTSASQPHRQMASGLTFPVGFKNDFTGNVETAISGILTSRMPHSHIGIDVHGHISQVQTKGNTLSHLVLRGSNNSPNYDEDSVNEALELLAKHHLKQRVIIDCSHGNCGKNHIKQALVFEDIMEQSQKNPAIAGFMLESHLFSGKQPLSDIENLGYGISITDPCIGWEETAKLLLSKQKCFCQ